MTDLSTPEKITIIEGPTPTFEVPTETWALSLVEGPLYARVATTRLRTFNGPTLVDWRWETSAGETTREEPLVFTEAATQTVRKSLVVYTPNDYWAQLHILAPNDLVTQVQFVANCIP